jgi:glutamate/tyrosine decarboxylase-like PLP-dependent enzyme
MGGIDHFEGVSKICKKYNLWFHIDACWGGHNYFAPEIFAEKTKGS